MLWREPDVTYKDYSPTDDLYEYSVVSLIF